MNPQALLWMAEAVGNRAAIQSVSLLVGATSSEVCAVDVAGQTGMISLVLRLFTNEEWLREEPDLARHEAWGLQKAGQAAVPTPELVAFDETGEGCGVPAVLMTRLPGAVELQPDTQGRWLQEMADALVSVHAVGADNAPWSYCPYTDLSSLEPPAWSSCPEHWGKAIEIIRGPAPPGRRHFIHRDYHPNNVLFQDGKLIGIVDWPNSCLGAAGIDVAWCRQNLAQLHGVTVADQFLTAYEEAAGNEFTYHPYWDLIAAIEFLPGPPDIYPGWTAHGVDYLTKALVRQRLDDYIASILARG